MKVIILVILTRAMDSRNTCEYTHLSNMCAIGLVVVVHFIILTITNNG